MEKILQIIDWFLPQKIMEGNLINKYRQRVAVFFLLSQLPLCFGFGLIFHFGIPLGGMNIIAPLGGVIFIVALYASKCLNRPYIIAQAGPAMTLVSICYAVYLTGGIESPIVGSLLLVPLVAGMVGGKMLVVAWSCISLVFMAYFAVIHHHGVELSNSIPHSFNSVFSFLSTAALIFLILVSFMMRSWIESVARKQVESLNQDLKIQMERIKKFGQAKQDFLTTMSHEIRTPINGIIGATELIADRPLEPQQKEHFSIIQNCSEMLLQIINNILDFSRLEQNKVQLENVPFSLEKSLKDAISIVTPLVNRKNITLSYSLSQDIPPFLAGDPTRLAQVFLNLLNNACKYTYRGKIHIDISKISQSEKNTRLRCEIKDTGIGITPENLEKIFARYSRPFDSRINNLEGTGLGLNISKKIVELMGGVIGVESEYGLGSTFWFEVPFSIADNKPGNNIKPEKSDSNIFEEGEKILLVEDNPINQMVALKLLKKNNITADLAENGKACLEMLKENDYKLILMDLKMPVMDGFEATRLIREGEQGLDKQIPIIALTANADDGTKEKCLSMGMDAILHKPFKFADLMESMSKIYTMN